MLEYILLSIVIILITVLRWKYRKFIKLSKIFKHNLLSLPILGVSYMFVGSDEDRMETVQSLGREALKKDDGNIFIWLGHYPFIVVADPEIAEYVSKTCLEKHHIMILTGKPFLGNSGIIAPVPIWRPRRKILIPTFSPRNLNYFFNIFVEQSNTLVKQLKHVTGKPISAFNYIVKYTMESVCQTTLGTQLNVQESPEQHPVVTAIEHGFRLGAARMLQPWLHTDFIFHFTNAYKTLMGYKKLGYDFTGQLIESQRKRMQDKGIKKDESASKLPFKSFLELLIEGSGGDKGYTDQELTEEVIALIVAGSDTSAAGAGFTALMLARHPDVQEKIADELKQVFHDKNEDVKPEHLPNLKYLEAVIKESLRLYTPAPIVVRQSDKDITLPSGVVLPKGCGFMIHLWAINRNPRYWGADAEEFRPERFLEGSFKHPAQFASFSLGPRNCVGYQYALMSMKTALATLLRHYRVVPADPTTILEPLQLSYGIMMKDANNFTVQLEPRN